MYFLQVLNSSSDPESQLYELDILALPEAVMPGVSLGGLLSFPF